MIASGAVAPFRPDRLIMGIVFAASIVAGWVMLPGENERVAMLESDGHSREALAILEHQVSAGSYGYRTLHQILALYENEGNVVQAQSVLEAMVRERPRDGALKRRLAQFYKNNQKDAQYIATLQDIVTLRYSESTCRELIGRLRLKGDITAEQSALQRCRQKGYRRADDLSRLAELLAVDGDTLQATTILKSIDDLKRLKSTRERYQLLQLLVENDQPNEAARRAVRWIRSTKDDGFAIGVIDVLARSKFADTAIEVAKETGAPGDSISLTVAERLIERTENGAAQLYLRGWLEKSAVIDLETSVRFVNASIAAGDPRMALRGAHKFGLPQIPVDVLKALDVALRKGRATADADQVASVLENLGAVTSQPRGTPSDTVGAIAPQIQQAGSPKATIANGLRSRTVPTVDPLESWRRSLVTSMTGDAQRRMQALFVGPKQPSGFTTDTAGRLRDARGEHRGSARLLKKTSRVLQRTKKLSSLREKRKSVKAKTNVTETP